MVLDPDRLRRDAKVLRKTYASGDPSARARVHRVLPGAGAVRHADALHVLAREQGYESWPKLKTAVSLERMDREDRAERLKLALFLGQHWVVDQILARDPDVAVHTLGLAVALYRTEAVRGRLTQDPGAATRTVGVRRPILHLAFSRYWRHVPDGARRSVEMAELLVAHGADVNDGYPAEPGSPHTLSALYGALGHAGNLDLARWLLAHGADPNDNESLYHATELGHADGLRLLLAHGARTEGTNALLRALDFDDPEMVSLLLDAGADPNEGVLEHPSGQPMGTLPALHQAARRMCSAPVAQALVDRGTRGDMPVQGHTAYGLARMFGNAEVARVLEAAGQATPLSDDEALIARTVARTGEADGPFRRIDPETLTPEGRLMLHRLLPHDGTLGACRRLVALGIDPDLLDEQGMPAIHIAGWEGLADAVEWLLSFAPDLAHRNRYGGDLMGTVLHGADFCPRRARRDHMRCAQLVLDAGSRLHRSDVEALGNVELAETLSDWAEAHPGRVIEGRPR